jgi:V/A-type H+-transporting ATPase subunit A
MALTSSARSVRAEGTVVRVNGPLVEVGGLAGVSMADLVEVGSRGYLGEVVAIRGETVTVQVYESTGGLRCGERVVSTHGPLAAWLGPGLLGGVFDGLLRPLSGAGTILRPGVAAAGMRSREERWEFQPVARPGTLVSAGTILGVVPETRAIEHRVLVPPGVAGELRAIAPADAYRPSDRVALVGEVEVGLASPWPVRRPRPVRERLDPVAPLVTGLRVLDLLFPLARGSTAAVPGGFGTGKTVLLQQIAKSCDADVIVYVGCGERGNEMADVLEELRDLEDPRTGRLLLERTVIIANTSNMPIMAREASIYTGISVGEYYRDMGYDTVVIADSTSRWAEALREISSRAGGLPVEEGYPAELASALAAFYERAGRVRTLGGDDASVSIIASVSPPGGDKTEPVTAHTRRFVRCLWSLDRDLAAARHYPAVSWRESFARDAGILARWYASHGDPRWARWRARAMAVLAEADRLQTVAELIGESALPDRERVILLAARLLREAVLEQNALSRTDAYCTPAKQAALLDMVMLIYDRCLSLIERGVPVSLIEELDFSDVVRVREAVGPEDAGTAGEIGSAMLARLEELVA